MQSDPITRVFHRSFFRLVRNLSLGLWAWLGISSAFAVTDISALSTGANTAVILDRATDSAWTVNGDITIGTLSFTRTGPNQTLTLTGAGTLTFSNASTPTWITSSWYSSYDYAANLAFSSSTGLTFTGKANALVLQTGISMAGVSGTFIQSNGGSDGSMIFAQGNEVLPSNANFVMIGGTGTNGYGYSKLVLNGGSIQTIGALSSSGTTSNIFIGAWNGDASLLTGGSVSSGTNTTGASSAATLRIGNNNASATFAGVIGSGATTGSVVTTDSSTRAINLVKLGSGIQTLTGVNTYSGATTVNGGTLALSGSGSIASTSVLAISAGATLDASVQTSPAINLGSVPLSLGVGSATRGFLNIGSGTMTLGSSLTLNFESSTLGSSYDLYDGTVSGSFSTIAVNGAIGTGSLVNSAGTWTGTIGAYILSLDQASGVLSISPSGGGTPPSAPATLTVDGGFEQITLSWSAVPEAVSYTVKRSATEGSGYLPIATGITDTTYTDTTVTIGETYFYVVVAVNVNGDSDPSPFDSGVSNVQAAIGINLRAFNTYGLPVTDIAGVSRKAWWNNLVGPALSGQAVSLSDFRDHLGNPVPGLSASFTAGSASTTGNATIKYGSDSVTVGPASNDLNLYSSAFDQYNGTASTLTVTGIPYSSYDFVVYDDGSARGGVITANGSTLAVRGGAGSPAADGSGYVRSSDSTNTSGGSVAHGNYVRFTGLTGDLAATFLATNMGDST